MSENENENIAVDGPGAADQGDNPAAPVVDEHPADDYDPAGKGGVPANDKGEPVPADELDELEPGEHRREHRPGDDVHAVKVGTDDQGNDVFAHHDAAGARFAL